MESNSQFNHPTSGWYARHGNLELEAVKGSVPRDIGSLDILFVLPVVQGISAEDALVVVKVPHLDEQAEAEDEEEKAPSRRPLATSCTCCT